MEIDYYYKTNDSGKILPGSINHKMMYLFSKAVNTDTLFGDFYNKYHNEIEKLAMTQWESLCTYIEKYFDKNYFIQTFPKSMDKQHSKVIMDQKYANNNVKPQTQTKTQTKTQPQPQLIYGGGIKDKLLALSATFHGLDIRPNEGVSVLHILEKYNTTRDSTIDDRRYVAKIGVKRNEYIVKIAPVVEATEYNSYENEIRIYRELTEAQQTDSVIANRIIKIYGSEMFNKRNPSFELTMTINNVPLLFARTSEINRILYSDVATFLDYYQGNTNFYWYILECKKGAQTLANCIDMNKRIHIDSINDLIRLLMYMNDIYGFCHWDLKSDNILLHEKRFVLFDFDLSSTRMNPNFNFVTDILRGNIGQYNLEALGFFHDVSKLLYTAEIEGILDGNGVINVPEYPNIYQNFGRGYLKYIYPRMPHDVFHVAIVRLAELLYRRYIMGPTDIARKYYKYKSKYLHMKFGKIM